MYNELRSKLLNFPKLIGVFFSFEIFAKYIIVFILFTIIVFFVLLEFTKDIMLYCALLLILSSTIFCMEDEAEETTNSLTNPMPALVREQEEDKIPSLSEIIVKKIKRGYRSKQAQWVNTHYQTVNLWSMMPGNLIQKQLDFWDTGKFHFEAKTRVHTKQCHTPTLLFLTLEQIIKNRNNSEQWNTIYNNFCKIRNIFYEHRNTIDALWIYTNMPNLFNTRCIGCFCGPYDFTIDQRPEVYPQVLRNFFKVFVGRMQSLPEADCLALFDRMIFSRTVLQFNNFLKKLDTLQRHAIQNHYPLVVLKTIDTEMQLFKQNILQNSEFATLCLPIDHTATHYTACLSAACKYDNESALDYFLQKTLSIPIYNQTFKQIKKIAKNRNIPFQKTMYGFIINPKNDENKPA